MSLYTELQAIGAELDHWQSDLYVKPTPDAMRIVRKSQYGFSWFRATDTTLWVEVPFAYQPYWDGRQKAVR